MVQKIIKIILGHKIIAALAIIVLLGGGYYWQKSSADKGSETSYVLASVEKGTIIASVSGTGQVSASNEVEIKPEASGKIIYLGIKTGQAVAANAVIAQIDTQDAYQSVKDAETNMESARLALEKLKEPASEYSLMQAENSLASAKNTLEKLKLSQPQDYQKAVEAKQDAEDDLDKAYEDAFNTIADVFLDLPTIITKLNDILYSTEIAKSDTSVGTGISNIGALTNVISDLDDRISLHSYEQSAASDYETARAEYDASFANYKNASRYSERNTILNLLNETLATARAAAEATKSESNYLDAWSDLMSKKRLTVFSKVKEYQTSLSSYVGQTSGHVSSLLSSQTTIKNDAKAIISAENDIKEIERNNPLDLAAAEAGVKEKEASLENLQAGPDKYELRAQELAIKQKEIALADAKAALADYTVRAPFAGVIAAVDVAQGDTASANTAIATVITKQSIAEISFNEIDAAKIKVGQKATITFDALEGLNITGQVAEVDLTGTVSSGVVSYGVKITFDIQDDRIKPGMSVSAVIITEIKQDALIVPNSAIKTQNSTNYVEMFDQAVPASQARQGFVSATPPKQQTVEVGIANDTLTEIISGLKEGDQVVTSTINSSSSQTTTQRTPSLFGGGGAFR